MPDILLVILAVIFVLGIAINIHEFGHFIVAKLFGMRVEAYSFFGLGPRIFGFKIGHTDYRVSAIPLGAYVKLYGDEATASLEGGESDDEKVPDSELYELRPRWQKFLVMLGGPFMNIMLALAIPFGAAMIYGIPSMPAPLVGVVKADGAAAQAGIQKNDRIVNFGGVENPTWDRIRMDSLISPEQPIPITVDRGGQKVQLTITPKTIEERGNKVGEIGLLPDVGVEPVVVTSVVPDSPSEQAGLQKGDKVLFINGEAVRNSNELPNIIRENKENPVALSIERNGEKKEIKIQPKQGEDGVFRIGTGFGSDKIITRDPATVSQAASFAVNTNWQVMRVTGQVFGQLFSGQRSVKDAGLAGPVGIVGQISDVVKSDGFAGLIPMLMLISLNLGIFNLLPIPLLDGGQIMVLGIEKVMSFFGKTLSMAIKEKIQFAGLAIILLLMVFTLFLDISRFF